MRNLHDEDYEGLIFDGVDDAVLALAEAIPVLPGKLFAAMRARSFSKRLYSLDDPLAELLLGDILNLSNR